MSNNKRLERDLSNKVLGGVCSGLGNFFDMDPAFWRVIFFFLFLLGCSGLLIYIILWIVMPSKKDGEPSYAVNNSETSSKRKGGNYVAGITLIAIGALCLISRYIPQINWHTAWPIVLIILGIILILPISLKKS